MAMKYTVQELIPELQSWIKRPTDAELRKLLRKTISTLNAFVDLVGEPEPLELNPPEPLPTLPDRIKEAE
jgi:hypothetical protein